MTAEVAVMNRMSVALAADSAVTVGSEANKIYTSADKLFQLCDESPIGIVVYGNASFCGMPWETIIKSYRQDRKGLNLGTVAEYGDDFISFLTGNLALFPDRFQSQQLGQLVYGLFISIRNAVKRRIDEEIKNGSVVDDANLPSLVEDVLNRRLEELRTKELLEGIPKGYSKRTKGELSGLVSEVSAEVLGTLPAPQKKLMEIVTEYLLRACFFFQRSGVVIAGFGSNEYTPALLSCQLEEAIFGHPRWRKLDYHSVAKESDCIMTFAQQEPVQHFLQGIDQDMDRYMRRSARVAIDEVVSQILQQVGTVDSALATKAQLDLQPTLADITKRLFDDWVQKQQEYCEPVLSTIAALPKDELAAMAEALVNLTKFRRRVTPQRETVGGPIDVAVFTKGDGFIWLSRKHYFDPALNPCLLPTSRGWHPR